jgi:hypothetical protein
MVNDIDLIHHFSTYHPNLAPILSAMDINHLVEGVPTGTGIQLPTNHYQVTNARFANVAACGCKPLCLNWRVLLQKVVP